MLTELERKKKSFVSKLTTFLSDHSKQYLNTMIVGNTIALVVYGYFMGQLLINLLKIGHLPQSVSIVLQTIISALVILVTAEFLPKVIFNIFPNKLFKFFSPVAFFFYIVFYPITLISGTITSVFLHSKRKTGFGEDKVPLKEELVYFIDEKLEENTDEDIDSEVHIFKNALNFHELKARDCMIHRKEIIAVDIDDSIEELRNKFIDGGISKIVVYKNDVDNIIGYVHSFDLFKRPKEIRHVLMPIELVHETTSAQEVMNRLLKKKKSIAIVLDEYGGTSGLLTLEDIVEKLFGDIEDEHDKNSDVETVISNNHYLFSAKLKIKYLNDKYNLNIPESDNYSSLGGFIIYKTEDIPLEKSVINYKDKKFIITKVSNSKIEEIEVFKLEIQS